MRPLISVAVELEGVEREGTEEYSHYWWSVYYVPGPLHTFFIQSSQAFKVDIIVSILHVRKLKLRVIVTCLIFNFFKKKASDGVGGGEVGTVEMDLPKHPPPKYGSVDREKGPPNIPPLPPLKCKWTCYGGKKPLRTMHSLHIYSLTSWSDQLTWNPDNKKGLLHGW